MPSLRAVPDPVRAPRVSPRDDLLRREDYKHVGAGFDREAFNAGWAAARARGVTFGCEACQSQPELPTRDEDAPLV
jgi:hypothetical protein